MRQFDQNGFGFRITLDDADGDVVFPGRFSQEIALNTKELTFAVDIPDRYHPLGIPEPWKDLIAHHESHFTASIG